MSLPFPGSVGDRPVVHGRPVPYATAWSSEILGAIRTDPLIRRPALFAKGRPGRGQPVWGALSFDRQRECVMRDLCGVCGYPMGDRFLPTTVFNGRDQAGNLISNEPPCCAPCIVFSLAKCPGLAKHPDYKLLRLGNYDRVLQIIDPGVAPLREIGQFPDQPEERARLSKIAARIPGGLVCHVKVLVKSFDEVTPTQLLMEATARASATR